MSACAFRASTSALGMCLTRLPTMLREQLDLVRQDKPAVGRHERAHALDPRARREVGDAHSPVAMRPAHRRQIIHLVGARHPLDVGLEQRQVDRRRELHRADVARLPGDTAVVAAELGAVVVDDRGLARAAVGHLPAGEVVAQVDDVGVAVQRQDVGLAVGDRQPLLLGVAEHVRPAARLWTSQSGAWRAKASAMRKPWPPVSCPVA